MWRLPGDVSTRSMLSKLYWCEGRSLAALAQAEMAVALEPHGVEAWLDLGRCYLDLGESARAIECLETGVAHRLPSASVSRNFAEALLLLGDYAAGWREYPEAKYQVMKARLGGEVPYMRPLLARGRWEGTPISGRLILQVDSGFGDCFMYARWVRRIQERIGALALRVDPALAPFLATQFSGVEILGKEEDPGEFEAWTSTNRLPHLFGVERPEDVACAPYLRATTELPPLAGTFRVGLRWAGDPTHATDTAARPRWLRGGQCLRSPISRSTACSSASRPTSWVSSGRQLPTCRP